MEDSAARRPGLLARLRAATAGGPLGNRSFQLLSMGQLASTIGDLCYAVALPWLVLSNHGGTVLLGAILACYGIPRTVLIPVGGILADRIGPRVVMLIADAARCVLLCALVVVAAHHTVSLAVLGPLAALIGAGEGLFLPASFAIIPSIVVPQQLQAANSISTALNQVGSLLGPVLGGLLVATAGPAPAFAVDAASFAISAVALALIRTRPQEAGDETTGPADAEPAPGVWSLLRTSRLLQITLVVIVVANLTAGGTFEVALPALAHERFGAAGYGAMIACLGLGALGGTLIAARATNMRKPGVVTYCVYLGEGIAICFVPYLGGLPGAAAAITVLGACNSFGNILMITLLQQWAPARLLGRIMSLIMLAALGSFPASVAVAGVLIHRFGPAVFFPVAGITLVVTVLAALTQQPIRDFGTSPAPGPAEAS
jgi:predicted MFS family arabinose efflux permease